MKNREWKQYLRQSLQQEVMLQKKPDGKSVQNFEGGPVRIEETINLCTEIMREERLSRRVQEPRTSFVQYLSDIFRFEGIPVLGMQAAVLFTVCLIISTVAGIPKYIPIFMPLFVLAAIPTMFKCRYCGMSEIEAVTRASGAQIVLAKLILAGAANLVCTTILISFEVSLQNSCGEIRQMILYCLVPYLVCMVGMLRLIRLRRKENIQTGIVLTLGSCAGWGMLARNLPWLYEASALGLWIAAFLFFAAFFIKEIYDIIIAGKEGKMYGIIA